MEVSQNAYFNCPRVFSRFFLCFTVKQCRQKRYYPNRRTTRRPAKAKKALSAESRQFFSTQDFFDEALKALNVDVRFNSEKLAAVPRSGPVVFVANHPYGVLDGLVLTWLARKARPNVKIMANKVLCQIPNSEEFLLPVDFSEDKAAARINLNSRRVALTSLMDDGAIGVFPAGGVGASEKPLAGPALDTPWHPFVAKLIRNSGATVIPVYFTGQNFRMFQLTSHLSYTWRLSLFFFETTRRMNSPLEIVIGDPITPDAYDAFLEREALNAFLREKTFELALETDWKRGAVPRHDRAFHFPKHIKFN